MTTSTIEKAVETRIQPFEIRDVDEKAGFTRLCGRAVPYDEFADIGWFMEQHEPGSLAKSIKEAAQALPLLLFHDTRSLSSMIGSVDEWQDSRKALDAIWKLEQHDEAQRAAELVHNGTLTRMSIGFVPIRSDWKLVEDFNPDLGPEHKDRVVRQESRLLETSLVSAGAFVGAQTKWVRTAGNPKRHQTPARRELAVWREELERLRADA